MTHAEATGKTIAQQFGEFHAKNPQVYDTLVKIGRGLIADGHTFNFETLWDRMRWLMFFDRPAPVNNADARFKLNDIYCSRYSRLIMEQEPDFAGMFTLRKLRS